MCTRGPRFNNINRFYHFLTITPKWTLFFFFPSSRWRDWTQGPFLQLEPPYTLRTQQLCTSLVDTIGADVNTMKKTKNIFMLLWKQLWFRGPLEQSRRLFGTFRPPFRAAATHQAEVLLNSSVTNQPASPLPSRCWHIHNSRVGIYASYGLLLDGL